MHVLSRVRLITDADPSTFEAHTLVSSVHSFDISEYHSFQDGSPTTADVVLRGIDMHFNCDPLKQPAGQVCNSNATWPIRLNFDISNCSLSSSTSSINCNLLFELLRGYTPSKGIYILICV
jgi:hypothetical protein